MVIFLILGLRRVDQYGEKELICTQAFPMQCCSLVEKIFRKSVLPIDSSSRYSIVLAFLFSM